MVDCWTYPSNGFAKISLSATSIWGGVIKGLNLFEQISMDKAVLGLGVGNVLVRVLGEPDIVNVVDRLVQKCFEFQKCLVLLEGKFDLSKMFLL